MMKRSCTCVLVLMAGLMWGGSVEGQGAKGKEGKGEGKGKGKVSVKVVKGLGNDGAEMVFIPLGDFMRGSNHDEPDAAPQRRTTLSAYYIDRFAVSEARYRECVSAGQCSAPDVEEHCNWGKPGKDEHPVNCVSWFQADEYCRWAGKLLPTEAQWEKAAKGATHRRYPWGDRKPDCELANFALDPDKKKYCHDGTVPVSKYTGSASPWGAVQMAGNVFHWVKDWYGKEYYRTSEVRDPMGPYEGTYRVVRGGSWFSREADLRTTMRGPLPPGAKYNYLGFRCVMYASDVKKKPAAVKQTAAGDAGPHACTPGGCVLPFAVCQALCQ